MPSTPRQMPTMRAVVQHGYGPPDRVLSLATVPRPTVGPGQVLVRVRATSVNTPDWSTVLGQPRILRLNYGLRVPTNPIRGTDIAGIVEETGAGVTDLSPGDEVFGSLWDSSSPNRSGAFAEYATVPATQLVKKPAGVSFAAAGAAVMSGLTALIAVRDVGRVREGTNILVNGASGGVGTFAVQIAKAAGATVTAVCSTRNIELVRELGADHVIDYTREDFTATVGGYDVVLDNVMNHPPARTARVLGTSGILIPNSLGSGKWLAGLPRMATAALMKRLGSTDVGLVTCVVNQQNLTELTDLLDSGMVRVSIDRGYALPSADVAVSHMLTRRAKGKVSITV